MSKIKKRKYSREGCEECKRRKMKCDEEKPYCYNCSRLNKVCHYKTKNRKIDFSLESHLSNTLNNNKDTDIHSKPAQRLDDQIKVQIPQLKTEFPVKHYIHNGSYINNFVGEENFYDKTDSPQSPSIANLTNNGGLNPLLSSKFTNSISDILSPSDNDLLTGDINELRSLFDEASGLVHDMNDLNNFDILSFPTRTFPVNDVHHINDINLHEIPEEISNELSGTVDHLTTPSTNHNSHTVAIGHEMSRPKSVDNASDHKPLSIASSEAVSESYEKHNFQFDEFSERLINNENNGNFNLYDLNSPGIININHMKNTKASSNNELIEQLIKSHNLTPPHISYLKYLNDPIISFTLFPFASNIDNNEVVNILLKYANNCPYLLSAILAVTSSVKFNITGKTVHESSGQKYVSVCLKSLSEAFVNSSADKVNQFLNDIERLLLTVILLTSFFSSKTYKNNNTILNSWKTHLRGTKDLLVNYSRATRNQTRLKVSSGLALARTWFFAIEALASIATPLGGSLTKAKQQSDHKEDKNDGKESNRIYVETGYFDYETNPEYHDALVNAGFLLVKQLKTTEFNIFLGFTMNVVYLMQEFTHCLEHLRNPQSSPLPIERIQKLYFLMHKSKDSVIVPQFQNDYSIPETSPGHPNYAEADKISLPESAFGKFKTGNKTIYYSWFDISEQIHIESIHLRMLITKGFFQLSRDHAFVQQSVSKLFDCLYFIRKKELLEFDEGTREPLAQTENFYLTSDFDARAYMIQSPYRLCINLVYDEKLEMLKLFFMGLVKWGNGSALGALEEVNKRIENIKLGIDEEFVEVGQTDVVPFS
ncbi:hypothetical protein CLIB1444_05S03994 [[Candida] jaroonii]|uniref:Uncharacterized protein n=1 Tax=[Candida] jaroonii TaxID=467808 RepID=A0ACA9Y8B9_9ASCO|nr:hypothetical protein CLIB1444_05S03994 [[Candida] jaroonii]